jgi:photosynthetic reaction center cytochrome c subunit
MTSVRILTAVLLLTPLSLFAQGRGGPGGPPPGPPKNLKVLPAGTDVAPVMNTIRVALGVQCPFCHVAGNFDSDDNPKKLIARNMLRMTADLNASFPDGKQHVTCYTCHQGASTPAMEPPAADGRGGRGGGRGGRGGQPPPPQE